MLHALGIAEGFTQHLIAAANAQHRHSPSVQPPNGHFQPVLAHPAKVAHGIFASGQDHKIRTAQLLFPGHIAHPQLGMQLQRGKIREVGDMGQANHRNVDAPGSRRLLQSGSLGVLIVQLHPGIGHHAQHRNPRELLQHGKPRL